MKTLRDFDVKGKRVLVRCDFNVPLSEKGEISDDFRIKQTIPTIEYLIEKGARVILISHLGKPKGIKNQKYSLKPIALRLEELLEKKVIFLDDCIGGEVKKELEKMESCQIILLENLRFHKEEEENDQNFAKKLAALGEIYINDAFGCCHRVHASIAGIPKYIPAGAGLLLEKEISVLSRVLEKPRRPLVAIIGGIKIATKIKTIERFLEFADHLLLGGKISENILEVKGVLIGKPWPEEKVAEYLQKIDLTSSKLHLSVDAEVALQDFTEGYHRIPALGTIRKEEEIFDIGPDTIRLFSDLIKEAKMLVWSGPLGCFERPPFDAGTKAIAEATVRNHSAFKIAGGGDTNAFLAKHNFRDKFDHVSTGGGAMLEFLSGEKLPGIEALKK